MTLELHIMDMKERQDVLVARFNELLDPFDQYSYLIFLSGQLPCFPAELKTEGNKVRGCQSDVWISSEINGDILRVIADSDTLIIKGILYIICDIFNGATTIEAREFQFDFLKRTGLENVFESERLIGISSIINHIKKF